MFLQKGLSSLTRWQETLTLLLIALMIYLNMNEYEFICPPFPHRHTMLKIPAAQALLSPWQLPDLLPALPLTAPCCHVLPTVNVVQLPCLGHGCVFCLGAPSSDSDINLPTFKLFHGHYQSPHLPITLFPRPVLFFTAPTAILFESLSVYHLVSDISIRFVGPGAPPSAPSLQSI